MMSKFACAVGMMCIMVFSLCACSQEEEKPKVSFETLETNRLIANDNSAFLAGKWKAEYAPNLKILKRGDSTQDYNCPQGDGWASIDLLNENGKTVIQLKCSTYSMATGCMKKEDFEQRKYAQQEGHCNERVPFPLPKVVQ